MPNPFEAIRKLLIKPSPSVADADAGLAKADAIERDLKAVIATLTPKRDDILADEASRAKARQAVADAESQLADVAIARDRIEAARTAALAAEEDARRRLVYDATAAKLGDPAAHAKAYDKAARATLAAVRAMAEMSLEVANANGMLPAGAVPLQDPFEAFALAAQGFLRPGLPREIISERQVTLWCHEGTMTPIADQKKVTASSKDGTRGYVSPNVDRPPSAIAVAGNLFVEQRTFIETTFLPATINEWAGPYTQTRLALPGIFTPSTGAFAPSDAASFIAAIDAALAAETVAPPKRERKLELLPVTGDGEILAAA